MARVLKENWTAGQTTTYDPACSPEYLPNDTIRARMRRGQTITVLHSFTEPDSTHDPEVLPMFLVSFPDGYECELWSDEMVANAWPIDTQTQGSKIG